MLEMSHLRVVYGSGSDAVEAIGDLSLSVAEASSCVLSAFGWAEPLLRCLAGLMVPTSGEASLDGERIAGPPDGWLWSFSNMGGPYLG